jgi:predicted dithiol-disulfide oxidoreductase (DUF899 family)
MEEAVTELAEHPVVSQEEWLAARRALMAQEKAHMREGDRLAEARRALPWVRIETAYVFDTAVGKRTLAELFGEADQLILHHLMLGVDWTAACPGCSFQAEHIDGPGRHLPHHNVAIVAVSSAPIDKIIAYRVRMGWAFEWVSSFGTTFNHAFRVTFTKEELASGKVDYNFGTITADPSYVSEELPGLSVFFRDAGGQVYLTYGTFARGLDALLGANHYLDLVPEGRNDAAYPKWPRRHDEY